MDIRFLIEQLDEITRRGFMTGLGAAGALAYTGKKGLDNLEKSKEAKKKRNEELLNVYKINAGDSKNTVSKLLGKPDSDMDSGPYTFWKYTGPYLDSDTITITFGNGRSSWENLDGRVVQVEQGGKQIIRMDDAFQLRNKEFDDEESRIKKQAGDIAKKFSPAMGAGPDDWKLEETSDEAIARIVELSKDSK
jgi:hypothetical protein